MELPIFVSVSKCDNVVDNIKVILHTRRQEFNTNNMYVPCLHLTSKGNCIVHTQLIKTNQLHSCL